VDPIQYSAESTGFFGAGNHPYAGPNLEPGVQAPGADLQGADLAFANLSHANLSGAWLGFHSVLTGADLSFANLSGAHLQRSDFTGANLSFSNLSGANLWDTNFANANLSDADLSYSYAARGNIYLASVNATNANLTNISNGSWIAWGENSNFTNADFTGSYLEGEFVNSIFVSADLSDTVYGLQHANLTGATYSGGSLSNRTLFPAGFDPIAAGMTLVPEPTTALLIGLGLVGLSMGRRT